MEKRPTSESEALVDNFFCWTTAENRNSFRCWKWRSILKTLHWQKMRLTIYLWDCWMYKNTWKELHAAALIRLINFSGSAKSPENRPLRLPDIFPCFSCLFRSAASTGKKKHLKEYLETRWFFSKNKMNKILKIAWCCSCKVPELIQMISRSEKKVEQSFKRACFQLSLCYTWKYKIWQKVFF